MKSLKIGCIGLLFSSLAWAKPVELIFWHGMSGHLGKEVGRLTQEFNRSQKQFKIKPIYKGDYVETITSFAAAFRAHQAPAMVQIFEVGTAQMLSPSGVIKPVDTLMKEQGLPLPKEDFLPAVREFYSKNGSLMAMPFNLSTPVLYYNKEVLAKLGYQDSNFPQTWDELELLAKKLNQAGYACTYTTAYPGWILFESYLAIHGLALVKGKPPQAIFASAQLIHHYQRLKRWYDLHYFRYGGRADDATIYFTSGLCPLFSQSSGAYNSLLTLVPFQLGVAAMPLDRQASSIRHANVVGGAAIWAVSGQKEIIYKGIAQFFTFLAQPQIQKQWHEHTGYLPIGLEGIYAPLLQKSDHPILSIAKEDLEHLVYKEPMKSKIPQNQIRGINDEVLEAMFAGLLSAEDALDEAVKRSNHMLERFSKNVGEIFPSGSPHEKGSAP